MFPGIFNHLTLDSTLAELPTQPVDLSASAEISLSSDCRIAHAVQRLCERAGEQVPAAISVDSATGTRTLDTSTLLLAHVSILERFNAEVTRQKAAAESATRSKSAFLADMSHDIRTPMNGILGMTELALETNLAPEQREYLQIVKSSAESLLTLLNDILDFSKIEAGKLDLDPFDFNLRDGLADAMRSLAMRADEKDLELALDVATDVPDTLHADWGRLRQILTNLIGNALKFTEQGEIVIRVEKLNDAGDRANRKKEPSSSISLHFFVKDTGIGISPERVARIFEPYTQAETSTARQFGGTGLGLTISSRLVQLMGGRLWVESEVGKGSTFHFTARVGVSQKPTASSSTLEPEGLDGLRVLVVDDNSTNRQILRELLTTWSMHPTVADGGETALAELERAADDGTPFALVLMDALMPGMDGFAVAEQIRRRPGLAGATIMMLSSPRQGDTARCRELGVPRCLTKPLKQSDLFDAILDVLSAKPPERKPVHHDGIPTPPAPSRRFRVLLAEDNAVNQKLAVSLLAKQGHEVIVAHDGREATAALEQDSFDLVLMDLEMPNMNGLEATAHIREREANTGRHTPIVAMTAHAMKGDRERCLAGGMDGYLSKPIRASQLTQVLADFDVLGAQPARVSAPPLPLSADHSDGDILDRAAILARVGHDVELLKDLVSVFLDECPKLLGNVRAAVKAGDSHKLKLAAHTLKGAVSNFSTWPAFEAALRLETMGHTGDLVHAAEGLAALEAALARLEPALRQLSA